jgi:hypothetical protein
MQMNQPFLKKAMPHLVALAAVLLVIFIYFSPMFGGKVLKQYDVLQWRSTFQEIGEFEKATAERTFWTNSIFGGMPSYLIGATYHGNFTNNILYTLQTVFKHPADTIFLLFACFYILLLTFEVSPWLAIIGSLAFALSSFNFINIDAGHVTKGNAIAFIPLVLAGIRVALYKNKWLGAALTGVALSFELSAGHLQITYYLIFVILCWMIYEFVANLKQKTLPNFLLTGVLLVASAAVGIGTNITGLLATEEYGKYSIRSQSELTKTAQGKENEANTTSGLDKDYALAWSNGVTEPFTLLIPNFLGGASSTELSSSTAHKRRAHNLSLQCLRTATTPIRMLPGNQLGTAGGITASTQT